MKKKRFFSNNKNRQNFVDALDSTFIFSKHIYIKKMNQLNNDKQKPLFMKLKNVIQWEMKSPYRIVPCTCPRSNCRRSPRPRNWRSSPPCWSSRRYGKGLRAGVESKEPSPSYVKNFCDFRDTSFCINTVLVDDVTNSKFH